MLLGACARTVPGHVLPREDEEEREEEHRERMDRRPREVIVADEAVPLVVQKLRDDLQTQPHAV
eukprot:4892311-Pleurochrysis_carterae.AAC.1